MPSVNLHDLDQLARFWPLLFGRALDPSQVLGVQGLIPVRSGRSDATDAKSPEIQAAIRALDRLYELHQEESSRQAAEVLLYARVACGHEARQSGAVFFQVGFTYAEHRPRKISEERRRMLIFQGRRLYDKACALYQREGRRVA